MVLNENILKVPNPEILKRNFVVEHLIVIMVSNNQDVTIVKVMVFVNMK